MNSLYYKLIKNCRLCSGKIKKIIDFGKVSLGNNLKKNNLKAKKTKKYPLSINNCIECNHYQLGASVDPKILYATNYTYLSCIGQSFQNHFDNYSKWLIKKVKFKKDDYILDIGSNDGTCLSFFKKKGIKTLGIDPAKLASNIANKNGLKTINKFFDKKSKNFIEKKYGKPVAITSHNVLAHIDNLKEIFVLSYNLLSENGYLCFEVGYFKDVIENKFFDTIYHEHLDYHHANPLVKLLNRIGFSVSEISINKVQGGSIRILCKKSKLIKNSNKVNIFCNNEKKTVLYNLNLVRSSFDKFFQNAKKIHKFFNNNKEKIIVGYGAPTKAVLLNKIINIDNKNIKFTLEDNILKSDKFLPTTCIKVKKFDVKLLKNVDYIFIYAWNFSADIITKIKKYNKIACLNLYIIIPLPKLKIIKI